MKNRLRIQITQFLFVFCLCLGSVAHATDTPEDIFWNSVSRTNLVEEYQLYVEQYPKGKYLKEARKRMRQFEAQVEEERRKAEATYTSRNRSVGQICNTRWDCGGNLECVSGTCQSITPKKTVQQIYTTESRSVGQSCNVSWDCIGSTICSSGICRYEQKSTASSIQSSPYTSRNRSVGQLCNTRWDCGGNLECVSGTCNY